MEAGTGELSKLILFFGLGAVAQAVMLIRGCWEWRPFLFSLGCSLLGLLPGKHERNYTLTTHLLFCLLIFICSVAVAFREALLPRVNEKILLAYTLTLWYAFFSFCYEPGPLSYSLGALFIAPTLGVLWLALTERPLSFGLKLSFYGWYLLMVVFMVLFQFSYSYLLPFFSETAALEATPAGALLSGMAFCYMVVNGTYIFHMVPVRGKNESREEAHRRWHGWVDLMTGRFNDGAQLSGAQAFFLVLLLGGFLAGNYFCNFISAATAVNLGILIPLLLMPGEVRPPAAGASRPRRA